MQDQDYRFIKCKEQSAVYLWAGKQPSGSGAREWVKLNNPNDKWSYPIGAGSCPEMVPVAEAEQMVEHLQEFDTDRTYETVEI